VEWVEKTGKSIDEAKERALDQLGVAEKDAELVVLAEPKTGLFGRVRGEARVRARVRPAEPRPKRARRQRDRVRAGGRNSANGGDGATGGTRAPRQRGAGANGSGGKTARGGRPGRSERGPSGQDRDEDDSAGHSSASRRRRRRRRSAARKRATGAGPAGTGLAPGDDMGPAPDGAGRDAVMGLDGAEEEHAVAEGITLEEQAAVAKEFLEGLLDRYGFEATVDVRELDEETVELAAHGDGLGVLVGPKGATVTALQDVTRTVVQKHFPNRTDRILVDVAGYRERRIAALRRFATDIAAEVLESGSERALEPMSAADRKVVHDTVLTIEGVASSSQGEDPHRFVVISPAS
jgi:spoIIIJ-associated protein